MLPSLVTLVSIWDTANLTHITDDINNPLNLSEWTTSGHVSCFFGLNSPSCFSVEWVWASRLLFPVYLCTSRSPPLVSCSWPTESDSSWSDSVAFWESFTKNGAMKTSCSMESGLGLESRLLLAVLCLCPLDQTSSEQPDLPAALKRERTRKKRTSEQNAEG